MDPRRPIRCREHRVELQPVRRAVWSQLAAAADTERFAVDQRAVARTRQLYETRRARLAKGGSGGEPAAATLVHEPERGARGRSPKEAEEVGETSRAGRCLALGDRTGLFDGSASGLAARLRWDPRVVTQFPPPSPARASKPACPLLALLPLPFLGLRVVAIGETHQFQPRPAERRRRSLIRRRSGHRPEGGAGVRLKAARHLSGETYAIPDGRSRSVLARRSLGRDRNNVRRQLAFNSSYDRRLRRPSQIKPWYAHFTFWVKRDSVLNITTETTFVKAIPMEAYNWKGYIFQLFCRVPRARS